MTYSATEWTFTINDTRYPDAEPLAGPYYTFRYADECRWVMESDHNVPPCTYTVVKHPPRVILANASKRRAHQRRQRRRA